MEIKGESYLEELLRNALLKENITFEEQYRVYEKPGDYLPKYTLDFIIPTDVKKIVVECDGFRYHYTNQKQQLHDAARNLWLMQRGFTQILRFSTYDLRYNMNGCINQIKKILMQYTDLTYELKKEHVYNPEPKATHEPIMNRPNMEDLHDVSLYTAAFTKYYDAKCNGGICFALYDMTSQKSSPEIAIAYKNVNRNDCERLVIYEGLKRLKKSTSLTIFTESNWIARFGNDTQFKKPHISRLANKNSWEDISIELSKHNYIFRTYPNNLNAFDSRTHNQLMSRARQKAYRASDTERITIL